MSHERKQRLKAILLVTICASPFVVIVLGFVGAALGGIRDSVLVVVFCFAFLLPLGILISVVLVFSDHDRPPH